MDKYLSKKQRQELLSELRKEHERKFADRIRVILLIDEGQKYRDIAHFLFLDEKTILNWKNRYEEGGLERLVNDYYLGRAGLLSENQVQRLEKELDSRVYPSTQSIIDFVAQEFGVNYSVGGMTTLLHRLEFSFKKTKGVPSKANREEQEKFLRRYNGAKAHGPVYFADSTHPMLNPILASGWIRKGTEFEVKTSSGRHRVNINGAVDIKSLDIVSRSCKRVNQHSMCDLIRAIRKKNLDKKIIYLVLDNASYNRSLSVRCLAKELGVRLLFLPPYSPNLNPIERLWKFMKKKVLANQFHEDVVGYKAAFTKFFRGIKKYRIELETLLTDNFKLFGS